jgi:glycosyltransferase involved in cell wall biosynthesis
MAHPDLITVESGIGYPNGTFAKFKVYESYAIMHGYQGNKAAISASNDFWYDAVIPNSFNINEFDYSPHKHDYFLFLGRVSPAKGFHIAKQIAEATKTLLIVAGKTDAWQPDTKFVQYEGIVGPKKRALLLKHARATICASTFLEPFCGTQIESMISGTPVISSDWGAFTEYNKHGLTGFRCKTFEQFLWAANNIKKIEPKACRVWGHKFSLENVAPLYTEYFQSVKDIYGGKGWYEPRDDRTSMKATDFQ